MICIVQVGWVPAELNVEAGKVSNVFNDCRYREILAYHVFGAEFDGFWNDSNDGVLCVCGLDVH